MSSHYNDAINREVAYYHRAGTPVVVYEPCKVTDMAVEDLHDERKRFAKFLNYVVECGDLEDIWMVAERELAALMERTNGV